MFFKLESGRLINLDNINYIEPTHPGYKLVQDYPYYVSFDGDDSLNISAEDYERLNKLLFGEKPASP